ncbi:OPT family small oligopeptide transporter [Kwoniella dendrophila CBS 6074]|uniref:OPT family small oligopeptide transporter n=1 Tax=Kwoniella dendrophila CBS 6074 TaxID=1295534 RepID=A0AAX4K357_9TREE
MPISPREAEAYELPSLNAPSSSKQYDEEDEINQEDAKLLKGSDELKRGEEAFEYAASYRRAVEDEEVIGKGSNVEALIARTVPSTDDSSLPTLTLRVLILGSTFCLLGACSSMVFYFKSNAPQFSQYFVILATYPLGHFLADERIIPRGKKVLGWGLNNGPFSIKEAILVSVLSSSGSSAAYAADILAIMDLYYSTKLGPLPSILLLLTTQCIGFGLAGMLQSLLFLPFLLFPTLTSVSILCLVNNESWWMRTLGSGYNGLGVANWSFDWSSIGTSGPLYTPYWALGNYLGGLVVMIWVVMPLILVTNFWSAREFPSPVSAGLYNSSFQKFDVTSILKPDLSLDEAAYEEAKPLLLTPYFALTYGLSFAALSSVLVHVWLWHRDEIKEALSKRGNDLSDVHNKLMRSYPPVPSSWYIALLAINFVAAIVLVKTTPLQMPIWALLLAMAIATVFLVPVGIIAAVSNTQIGLNVLTEFVAGVLMPGKPIGNVTFKCYGYMAMSQALALTSDLKLGWYTSIPPREMFVCQILGTVLGALANYVTLESVLESKRPFLDGSVVDPTGQWTGRAPTIFYSASIIWGAVAPARFFSGGYEVLYLGFLLGALVPIACFYGHKRWPGYKLNKVVFPIICSGATLIPQYPTNVILTSIIVAVLSNSYFAKKYPKTHGKYIYVISSALDAGTSITALAIYVLFGGVLWNWSGPEWWGNAKGDTEHCVPGT